MGEIVETMSFMQKFFPQADDPLDFPEETNEDEEEGIATVENLSKNVSDLIISNENNEPGFRYTRWQQRKFMQNVRDQKIKYKYEEDENM